MGIHYTRPSLPQEILGKIQEYAVHLVSASQLASASHLEVFALEASRWVHTDKGQRQSPCFSTAPWQRGAAQFLSARDTSAAMAASLQAWAAFFKPSLTYAACRGTLCAWPDIWGSASPELRAALMDVDVHSLEDWFEALVVIVGVLACASQRPRGKHMLEGSLLAEIERQCNNYGLTSQVVHGVPSRRKEAEYLLKEAEQFLQFAVSAAAQVQARTVFSALEARLGLHPKPRPLRPRPLDALKSGLRSAGCVGAVPTSWLSACYARDDCGSEYMEIRPSEICAPDAEDKPVPVPVNTLKCLRWREGACLLPKCRSFYKLSDLSDSIGSIVTRTDTLKCLTDEFAHLWHECRHDFLPWQEHGEPVLGWRLFGTHLFGQRLEGNCSRAPIAAALAEAVHSATLCGYSVLLPGTHIEPHGEESGSSATRLHIALRIPQGGLCGLRVGSQVRVWEEAKVLAFDSTCQHEAWNFSNDIRAVLLLDFGAAPLAQHHWPRWLLQQLPDHCLGPVDSALEDDTDDLEVDQETGTDHEGSTSSEEPFYDASAL